MYYNATRLRCFILSRYVASVVGRPSKKIECGAYARTTGLPCRAKALKNGRCKLHGGLSTGPKTAEGKLKSLMNLNNVKEKITRDHRETTEG